MAHFSIIRKSNVLEAQRIDAEHFSEFYLSIEHVLKKNKCLPLGQICKLHDGPFGSDLLAGNYSDFGVPVIRMQNIKEDGHYNDNNLEFISDNDADKLIKHVAYPGEVVTTKIGFLGYTTVLPSNYNRYFFRREITRLEIINESISPYYLSVFLNSKYGRKQVERHSSGATRDRILLINQRKIDVPIFSQAFQKHIEDIVVESYRLNDNSKKQYKDSEKLLLDELGLINYKLKDQLTFETTKEDVNSAKRIDAEFFQPKYAEIIEKIKNYPGGFDFVKNIVSWKKGVEVGSESYTETGFDFVRVSDFSKFGIDSTKKKISKNLFSSLKEKFNPKKGDILFTKDGSIGISNVLQSDIEGVLSSAFLTLRLKKKYIDFEKECLSLIFNSVISKMQVEKLSGGAIISHLKPTDFEKFIIPLVKTKVQKQIAVKIQESKELREESKELLEMAKVLVENEIEKNSNVQ